MTSDERINLTLRLTLLIVVLFGPPAWYVSLSATAISIPLLAYPPWLRAPVPWLLLAIVLTQGVLIDAFNVDNHQYLLVYWVIAINVALNSQEMSRNLSTSARGLIAATFVFAVTWKVLGGDFFNGAFWEATLLTDERLSIPSILLGMSPEDIFHNQTLLSDLRSPDALIGSVTLRSTSSIDRAAVAMGWGGALLEAGVAVAYCLPSRLGLDGIRLGALLAFVGLVYVWLPVVGFAWILLAMSLMAHPYTSKRVVLATIIIASFLTFVQIPKEYSLALFL